MKTSKNPNNHKKTTPSTAGSKKDAGKFTSYNKTEETSTPQKTREANEPEGEQKRMKKSKG